MSRSTSRTRSPFFVLTAVLPMLLMGACGQEPALAPAGDSGGGLLVGAIGDRALTELPVDRENGLLGQSLPGSWRPFADDSPWNTPIPADAQVRAGSEPVMAYVAGQADNIRFSREYTIPVWVVSSRDIDPVIVRSDRIFDRWDRDRDGWSDVGVPLLPSMWGEPTSDGHICIIDPVTSTAWEMSRFEWTGDGTPQCTTFNIWDLSGSGCGDHNEGDRWQTRGGRGSGFPIIAGLVRPEEIEAGEIRHALVFTFSSCRMSASGDDMFLAPPACRADGKSVGSQYPIEGMCFQLDPQLDDGDFDAWGLSDRARIVARALQTYGMYLSDRGGDMALQIQLLDEDPTLHRAKWEDRLPGFYSSIERIPTDAFRIVELGAEEVVKP